MAELAAKKAAGRQIEDRFTVSLSFSHSFFPGNEPYARRRKVTFD